jgi:hypothetical protein
VLCSVQRTYVLLSSNQQTQLIASVTTGAWCAGETCVRPPFCGMSLVAAAFAFTSLKLPSLVRNTSILNLAAASALPSLQIDKSEQSNFCCSFCGMSPVAAAFALPCMVAPSCYKHLIYIGRCPRCRLTTLSSTTSGPSGCWCRSAPSTCTCRQQTGAASLLLLLLPTSAATGLRCLRRPA